MKVLLIHPYVTTINPYIVLTEPLGLAYLAAYLEGYDLKILDLFALGFNEVKRVGSLYRKGISDPNRIINMIKGYNPDLIGITCNFTTYASDVFEIAKLVKDNFSNIPVILGGAHATMDAENILKNNPAIDVVVRGEGEVTFRKTIEAMDTGKNLNGLEGISYRDNGFVVSNQKRDLIEDLNILPLPDRKKIPLDSYLKTNSLALPFTKRKPIATLMTSRGCPYDCIFCSTKVVWRRQWRPRSPEKVIEEIELLVKEYGAKEIAINDDQFMSDTNRVSCICDLLINKNLNVTLSIPSGTSVWLANYELLKKMKSAGFYRLCFPIETGNEKTLFFIRKPVNLAKARDTIRLANRLGMWTQGNFIIGFPYETKEEIATTIKYAFKSGLDYAIFFIAKPYMGSELFEIFKQEGLVQEIAKGSNVEKANYDTKTIKAAELQVIRDKASRRYFFIKILFYLNPINFYKYLLPKISSAEDFQYTVKILFRVIVRVMREKFVYSRYDNLAQ